MVLLATVVGGVTACGGRTAPPVEDTTVVVTTVVPAPSRPTPTPSFRPTPATPVRPLSPEAPPPVGQIDGPCPYLDTETARDLEGNRIGRTTISTAAPVTCWFWFYRPDYRATMEIAPQRFSTPTDAYNAMVLTGEAGSDVDSRRALVPGVDGVVFRTAFYTPDANRDWACSFAKGLSMVTVRTDRTDTSFNAARIAATVAPRF